MQNKNQESEMMESDAENLNDIEYYNNSNNRYSHSLVKRNKENSIIFEEREDNEPINQNFNHNKSQTIPSKKLEEIVLKAMTSNY